VGTSTLMTGKELVEQLGRGELFTDIATKLTGEEITAEVWQRSGPEPMSGEERRLMESWRDHAVTCHRRTGLLRAANGQIVAYVSSAWVPGRLPPGVQPALMTTDIPLGRSLADAGVVRECLRAREVSDRGIAVRSYGRLLLPGADPGDMVPVALAWEEIPDSLLDGMSWG
jgi:hypothetical protein